MLIPFWLVNFLTTAAYERVSQAISEAESKTHAEIIPVIVRSSNTQSSLLGPFLGLMFFLIFLYSPTVITVFSLSSAVVAILFFREKEREQMVKERARIEFLDIDLNQTQDNQGVLILVSMVEKRVELYLDPQLAEKVPRERWEPVRKEILWGLSNSQLGVGLVRGIDLLGDILQEVAPRQHVDVDELNNTLIIKE